MKQSPVVTFLCTCDYVQTSLSSVTVSLNGEIDLPFYTPCRLQTKPSASVVYVPRVSPSLPHCQMATKPVWHSDGSCLCVFVLGAQNIHPHADVHADYVSCQLTLMAVRESFLFLSSDTQSDNKEKIFDPNNMPDFQVCHTQRCCNVV